MGLDRDCKEKELERTLMKGKNQGNNPKIRVDLKVKFKKPDFFPIPEEFPEQFASFILESKPEHVLSIIVEEDLDISTIWDKGENLDCFLFELGNNPFVDKITDLKVSLPQRSGRIFRRSREEEEKLEDALKSRKRSIFDCMLK